MASGTGGQLYNLEFFARLEALALRSAEVVVPIILDFIRPRSVVDVGCGTGAWLSVFMDHGVDDVLGIDGDYVDRGRLLIPPERFVAADLAQPLKLDRSFDLVLSLEVAEHLPEMAAERFVESLTRLGSTVLFSAAIPGQGGTNHVNEQWPEYWAGLFGRSGFLPVDCLRDRIWHNEAVAWWYAQNGLIYCSRDAADSAIGSRPETSHVSTSLRRVHPKLESKIEWIRETSELRELVYRNCRGLSRMNLAGFQQMVLDDIPGLTILPFQERRGQFFGYPFNADSAISEVERCRLSGSEAIGFAWFTFWVLEQYPELQDHLRRNYSPILTTDLAQIWKPK